MKTRYTPLFNIAACCCLLSLAGCKNEYIFEGYQDVGAVKIKGSVSYDHSNQTYTLNGAGHNIWGDSDAFFMAWKKVNGNFSMQADVAFEGEGANPHRKLGIMIRENLTAVSPYADIAVHGDGLTSLQYRTNEDGTTTEIVSANKSPERIYMERQGNNIIIKSGIGNETLPDSVDAAITISLPQICYVGLFVCSHEDSIIETANFKNVVFKKLK